MRKKLDKQHQESVEEKRLRDEPIVELCLPMFLMLPMFPLAGIDWELQNKLPPWMTHITEGAGICTHVTSALTPSLSRETLVG